jgi:hypothetical protein
VVHTSSKTKIFRPRVRAESGIRRALRQSDAATRFADAVCPADLAVGWVLTIAAGSCVSNCQRPGVDMINPAIGVRAQPITTGIAFF